MTSSHRCWNKATGWGGDGLQGPRGIPEAASRQLAAGRHQGAGWASLGRGHGCGVTWAVMLPRLLPPSARLCSLPHPTLPPHPGGRALLVLASQIPRTLPALRCLSPSVGLPCVAGKRYNAVYPTTGPCGAQCAARCPEGDLLLRTHLAPDPSSPLAPAPRLTREDAGAAAEGADEAPPGPC